MQDIYKGLPIQFIIELYRLKMMAICRGDDLAIESLKETYPVLFDNEIVTFMKKFEALHQQTLNEYNMLSVNQLELKLNQ